MKIWIYFKTKDAEDIKEEVIKLSFKLNIEDTDVVKSLVNIVVKSCYIPFNADHIVFDFDEDADFIIVYDVKSGEIDYIK